MICRLNGRSRVHAQAAAERALREMVARGVRGQATSTTTLVSAGDGSNHGVGPTKGSGGESAMRIALLCASQMPSSSSEL